MLAGCATDQPWPPPLFDCNGNGERYVLRSSEEGSLIVEIEARSKGNVGVSTWLHSWTEIRTGWVGGQQGGHQAHVRLNDGQRNLIFYEGEDGLLADSPGRTYAGVVEVGQSGLDEPEVLAECNASATNRALLDNIHNMRDAADMPPLPDEVENGPFDAWF